MSFSCPFFDPNRDACLRLKTDCVPGRPGCVISATEFAVPVEQRLREREEEKRLQILKGSPQPGEKPLIFANLR